MGGDSKNLKEEFVKNAFVLAARDGQSEIVEELLLAGVDVHVWEDVALRLASIKGDQNTVRILLEAGADVHARGDEAIRLARENGHEDVATILVKWRRPGNNASGPSF